MHRIFPKEHDTEGSKPLFLETANGFARAEELAGKVYADDPLPLCEGHLIEGRIHLDPGVVDQDIDPPEFPSSRLEHFADLVLFRDIGLVYACLPAGRSNDSATRSAPSRSLE